MFLWTLRVDGWLIYPLCIIGTIVLGDTGQPGELFNTNLAKKYSNGVDLTSANISHISQSRSQSILDLTTHDKNII